jgi:hypothetical protein
MEFFKGVSMDRAILDTFQAALDKAKEELSAASYLEEHGVNAGLRKIGANKAAWLCWVVSLAEVGLAAEKLFGKWEPAENTAGKHSLVDF